MASWGRSPRRRLTGAAAALLGGVVEWGVNEGFSRLIYDAGHTGGSAINILDWTLSLALPTIAALAWGIARREGRLWPLGLVLAPALAGVYRHFYLFGGSFTTWLLDSPWWVRELVLLAPAVVAGIACWLLERRESSAEA